MKKLLKISVLILILIIALSACKDEDEEEDVVIQNTFQDSETSLEWQDNSYMTRHNYASANEYCSNLSMNGYSNWRLPTQGELYDLSLNKLDQLDQYTKYLNDHRYWTTVTLLSP